MPKKKISKKDLWLGENFWYDLFMFPTVYLLTFPTVLAMVISIYFFLSFVKFNDKFSLIIAIILFAFVAIEVSFRIFKKQRFWIYD